MSEVSTSDRVYNSFTDATKSLPMKIFAFVFLAIFTAIPYIIYNLNKVWVDVTAVGEATAGSLAWGYTIAIYMAVKTGYLLGLSTLFDSLLNIFTLINEWKIGTIIFSAVILLFAVGSVFQIVSFILDATDRKQGKAYSRTMAVAVSLVVVLFLAGASNLIMDGETITSSLTFPTTEGISELIGNTTIINETVSEEITTTIIDMAGESDES